jgi:hypothetical protein
LSFPPSASCYIGDDRFVIEDGSRSESVTRDEQDWLTTWLLVDRAEAGGVENLEAWLRTIVARQPLSA